ncbi:hypothetical protein ACFBZI_11165 [Moraxella sp. ZJ142]|uniref:hypothetical protein n=1 Tax=Moraxella marmotae TaxID=3344520 RepID=UPI0035D4EEE5
MIAEIVGTICESFGTFLVELFTENRKMKIREPHAADLIISIEKLPITVRRMLLLVSERMTNNVATITVDDFDYIVFGGEMPAYENVEPALKFDLLKTYAQYMLFHRWESDDKNITNSGWFLQNVICDDDKQTIFLKVNDYFGRAKTYL